MADSPYTIALEAVCGVYNSLATVLPQLTDEQRGNIEEEIGNLYAELGQVNAGDISKMPDESQIFWRQALDKIKGVR